MELESFLGLVNFYRQCVSEYAELTKPFADLGKKECWIYWSEEQQKAFDRLKVIIAKIWLSGSYFPETAYQKPWYETIHQYFMMKILVYV